MISKRRVCVIGAGTAGLSALKNSLEHGLEATAYEQCSQLGGTWVYTEQSKSVVDNKDEDVHSSMYEGLRTNLPKEVMGYPDFPYPETWEESFVSSSDVLRFLQIYAENFNLKPHIKFEHEVIRVRPKNDGWEVHVRDMKTNIYSLVYYDFIFVCNGHYTAPLYPKIKGMDIYRGQQIHSHLYRKAHMFTDATALVIGAGPSGMDIANHIRKVAKHVFLSHHLDPAPDTEFMPNVTQKPDVARFTETGAVFKDGSSEEFSYIVYCSGYNNTFPFLSTDCGIHVDENYVQPLYKHCINIRYPTMALIGLPTKVCPTQLFDLQVRFALKHYTNDRRFPSSEEMWEDMERDMAERWKNGLGKRQAHEMGEKQFDYYKELSELAGITNIKPVIGEIVKECGCKYIYELGTYRNARFKIIDDEHFVKFPKDKDAC